MSNFNELLAGAASADAAARAEFVVESRRQIERLRWLTAHLLDLSRLDAGLVALDRAPVAVGELLDDVAAAFRPAATERNVTIDVERAAGDDLAVPADRERLTMALSNLVDNAVKYTRPAAASRSARTPWTTRPGRPSRCGSMTAASGSIRTTRRTSGTASSAADGAPPTSRARALDCRSSRAWPARTAAAAARPVDAGGTRFTITLPI
ncbi:MAG: HAMP domain-containing sensor histidine kinase [Anaerolineae bacterium]